jgi:anti-sigma B factor antagonist
MNNQTGIIDIIGEMSGAAEEELMKAFNSVTDNGAKVILLNFSGLEYMNSSGIGLLVTLLIRANRNKQKLLACGLSQHYQEIFVLTRLNEAITIYDTEAQALVAT